MVFFSSDCTWYANAQLPSVFPNRRTVSCSKDPTSNNQAVTVFDFNDVIKANSEWEIILSRYLWTSLSQLKPEPTLNLHLPHFLLVKCKIHIQRRLKHGVKLRLAAEHRCGWNGFVAFSPAIILSYILQHEKHMRNIHWGQKCQPKMSFMQLQCQTLPPQCVQRCLSESKQPFSHHKLWSGWSHGLMLWVGYTKGPKLTGSGPISYKSSSHLGKHKRTPFPHWNERQCRKQYSGHTSCTESTASLRRERRGGWFLVEAQTRCLMQNNVVCFWSIHSAVLLTVLLLPFMQDTANSCRNTMLALRSLLHF